MLDIRRIISEDTYQIRQIVLRPTQSLEDCMYANDNHPDSFHLGAFKHDNMISVASFYQEEHPTLDGGLQYRLRGMATLAEFRNLKAGSSLLMEAERIMLEKGVATWWCNARVAVSEYYAKLGLSEKGDIFDIDPIGPHKLMYKQLSR